MVCVQYFVRYLYDEGEGKYGMLRICKICISGQLNWPQEIFCTDTKFKCQSTTHLISDSCF